MCVYVYVGLKGGVQVGVGVDSSARFDGLSAVVFVFVYVSYPYPQCYHSYRHHFSFLYSRYSLT